VKGPDLGALFHELIRFETVLWAAVDARLQADCDLPLHRFEPMQIIARTPDCRVHDIATELAITVGGTSRIVDRIEANGDCRRKANPADRRSSVIVLTPTGRRRLTSATKVFERELQDHLGDNASDRALDQLHTTLRKLRASQGQPGTIAGAR
jgi:DNA-binding MarR family transcriptional regulator